MGREIQREALAIGKLRDGGELVRLEQGLPAEGAGQGFGLRDGGLPPRRGAIKPLQLFTAAAIYDAENDMWRHIVRDLRVISFPTDIIVLQLCNRFFDEQPMRIKIQHVETRTGFPFKTTHHEVHLTADFTHEEKQIIRQRFLEDHVLMARVPADARREDEPDWYALRVRHLFERRPDRFRCATPSDAKLYAAELTAVMRSMKLWLEENAETGPTEIIEI